MLEKLFLLCFYAAVKGEVFQVSEQDMMKVLTCPVGKINSQSASYGGDNIKCNIDVQTGVKKLCQGKETCTLVNRALLLSLYSDPCASISNKYLEVRYTCAGNGLLQRIICSPMSAFVSCTTGSLVINIRSATFGRSSTEQCKSGNTANTNCKRDVTEAISYNCNNKESCILSAHPSEYGDPCINTSKYLDVKFTCVEKDTRRTTTIFIPSVPTAPVPVTTQKPGPCGISSAMKARVVNGENAAAGAWPWQVAIHKANGEFICGGSLINPYWLVSAAHCFKNGKASDYYVVLGDLDRSKYEGHEMKYYIKDLVVHADYDKPKSDNDIALLKLEIPAMFNNYISPVCLPTQGDSLAVGTECYITGWGKTRHPGPKSLVLKQGRMNVISRTDCQKKIDGAPSDQNEVISKGMICGKGYKDAAGCHGDSGGPFVCKENNKWVLRGAVSWGSPRCAMEDMYQVYANIANYRSWIDDKMKTV